MVTQTCFFLQPRNQNGAIGPIGFDENLQSISAMLRGAAQSNATIENFCESHQHYLTGCDGNGSYAILSYFVMADDNHKKDVLCTGTVIRCHDHISAGELVPVRISNLEALFEIQSKNQGPFQKAPYKLCSQLILEALERMRFSGKTLPDMTVRTVVRMYGLPMEESVHETISNLPIPSPATSVELLWLALNRPEYFYFNFNEELSNLFNVKICSTKINSITFERALQHISNDSYSRRRIYAMLKHMALWHTLAGENALAAWLLNERAAMMSFTNEKSQARAMESNIIFQLMINKFFDFDVKIELDTAVNGVKYGLKTHYYNSVKKDFNARREVPPNLLLTATIATHYVDEDLVLPPTVCMNVGDSKRIRKLTKVLIAKKARCAFCGTDKAKGNQRTLFQCVRCLSVSYCCKKHQVLDWKKGGHKQECEPKIPNVAKILSQLAGIAK